jgi:uncharacterized protein YkwD
MQKILRSLILALLCVLASFPLHGQAQTQDEDAVAQFYALVNEARLDEGLDPYAISSQLTTSAQRHADDMAANQISSPVGSDSSMPRQRIEEAGYRAWTLDSGEMIVGESLWTGQGAGVDALAFFLDDPPQRANLLSTTYREIGIGIATDADGRNYYVLDFGVRPNGLPIFINDGAANTDDPQVAIRLTNETFRPQGQGANFMGQAIEMRISNDPNLEDVPWQSWEPLIPWTLPDAPGEHTVYVLLRDAAGRTTGSTDTIVLGEGLPGVPAIIDPTPAPVATPIPPSPTPGAAATPAPDSTATLASSPTATPSPTPTLHVPSSSSSASVVTPFPTWTPLPTPTPQRDDVSSSLPPWLARLQRLALPSFAVLQGLAILLGIYLVLRRGGRDVA